MNTFDDFLFKRRLEDDEERRKLQKLGGRLLAIGGIIFFLGIVVLFLPLTDDQIDTATVIVSVVASLFFGPGIVLSIMGKEQSFLSSWRSPGVRRIWRRPSLKLLA